MKLIVGLGNPGKQYEKVRHNLGFMVLDELVDRLQVTGYSWEKDEKFKSEICNLAPSTYNRFARTPPYQGGGEGEERLQSSAADSTKRFKLLNKKTAASQAAEVYNLILVKPLTFMNNSGMAVVKLVDYFKVPPEDVVVIHDDLDLILGKIKVRQGGAAGGHHGVESIISALGSDQFIRVRLGIGNQRSHSGEHKRVAFNAEHFVLEPFLPNEKSKVKHMLKQAKGALGILISKGLDVAQNQFN